MKAHLFKYNPANWSWERYEDLFTRWRRGERVVENWSVHNFYKQIVVGSQAWPIGQGSAPNVICGFGTIVSKPKRGPRYDGVEEWMVDVHWRWLCDPRTDHLLDENGTRAILGPFAVDFPASGKPIHESAEILTKWLQRRQATKASPRPDVRKRTG